MEKKACYQSLVETIAALHSVDYKAVGLENYGRTSNFYPRQIERMHQVSTMQWKAGAPPLPNLDAMVRWFKDNYVTDECTLIHGDFKPDVSDITLLCESIAKPIVKPFLPISLCIRKCT